MRLWNLRAQAFAEHAADKCPKQCGTPLGSLRAGPFSWGR
jgi:hypothetical protein